MVEMGEYIQMYLRVIDKKSGDKHDWSVTIPSCGFGNITIYNDISYRLF